MSDTWALVTRGASGSAVLAIGGRGHLPTWSTWAVRLHAAEGATVEAVHLATGARLALDAPLVPLFGGEEAA